MCFICDDASKKKKYISNCRFIILSSRQGLQSKSQLVHASFYKMFHNYNGKETASAPAGFQFSKSLHPKNNLIN